MTNSQPIAVADRYLDECGDMVTPNHDGTDEITLYQCSSCQQWYYAGDTYVTGRGTEYCYNEPCRMLQEPEQALLLITGSIKLMTKQTLASPLGATYSITFDKADNWGSIECVYQVSVWHDTKTNEIAIVIVRSKSDNNGRYSKHFRDCETQHSDAERWVNDIIKYPNPIAGVFTMEAWKE